MLPGIMCTVSSCKFWHSGNHCNANAIEVNVDGGGSSASQSRETNCHTFSPKS